MQTTPLALPAPSLAREHEHAVRAELAAEAEYLRESRKLHALYDAWQDALHTRHHTWRNWVNGERA